MTTLLLALGWPLAALAIWRWMVNYRLAWEWAEEADIWKKRASALEGELNDARTLARSWESAALVWHAVVMAPLSSRALSGRVQ